MKYWLSVWVIAVAVATSAGAQETSRFGVAVQEILASDVARSDRPPERDAVASIYASAHARPIWTILGSGPTRQAMAAIEVLASSASYGLEPARYDVATLRSLASLAGGPPAEAARFDVSLTRAVTRLVVDLHMGRIDPQTLRFDLPDVHDRIDLVGMVTGVAEADDIHAAVVKAEPSYAGYHALKRALARYRVLASDTSLRPLPRPRKTIRPGDAYPDVATLARLLAALGDLAAGDIPTVPPAAVTSPPRFVGVLVDALVNFQARHGLEPDSVIGPATIAQLRVPLAQRVRQIELTLERWRWLPDVAPERYVVVNIPAFRLYAFESDFIARQPVLAMNVIVGQSSGRHDTPVFTATMNEVVFHPYWDVPPRIARTELIPIFRRQPKYFDREGFEIVRRGTGDVASVTFPPTPVNLARVIDGDLRLRQRPGPSNALGSVKFVFPNRYNVYLHDTPIRELFARTRRDFSHGCIRTEHPADLAELVLRDQSPWTRGTIDSVMAGDTTVHVPIVRPLTVFVLYATAVVDATGDVSFYPDLYRHDAALEQALRLTPVNAAPRQAVAR